MCVNSTVKRMRIVTPAMIISLVRRFAGASFVPVILIANLALSTSYPPVNPNGYRQPIGPTEQYPGLRTLQPPKLPSRQFSPLKLTPVNNPQTATIKYPEHSKIVRNTYRPPSQLNLFVPNVQNIRQSQSQVVSKVYKVPVPVPKQPASGTYFGPVIFTTQKPQSEIRKSTPVSSADQSSSGNTINEKIEPLKKGFMETLKNMISRYTRRAESSEGSPKSGFATNQKVVEIQLPLKIATKEDLVTWAKYVMSLMASKINITLSNLRDAMPSKNTKSSSNSHAEEVSDFTTIRSLHLANDKLSSRQGLPESRVQTIYVNNINDANKNFQAKYAIQRNRIANAFPEDTGIYVSPPQNYLPLPLKTVDATRNDEIPAFYSRESFATPNPSTSDDARFPSAMKINDLLFARNQSTNLNQILSFPFEAIITIINDKKLENQETSKEQKKNFNIPLRDPPDDFPPYFDKNFTFTNEFGTINVILEDSQTNVKKSNKKKNVVLKNEENSDATENDSEKNSTEESREEMKNDKVEKKKQSAKQKTKKKKKTTFGGQSTPLGSLLTRLGITSNVTNVTQADIAPALLTILQRIGPQKVQSSTEKSITNEPQKINLLPQKLNQVQNYQDNGNRERRNETSQNQDLYSDEDDEESSEESNEESASEEEEEEEEEEDDDDDDDEGGSLQMLVELLPLVVPILEDLSDPESDTNLAELLQTAIPLLQGLIEGDEYQDPVDIPGFIVPIILNILNGPDGMGSDFAAIAGPLLQLIAPLIGPIAGPLIGPLFGALSNGPQGGGSDLSTLVAAIAGPLSTPDGPYKSSPISVVLAGTIAALSKGLADGTAGVDLKSLITNIVSGTLVGSSLGSKGVLKHKDSVYAPTSYGGYGGYGGNGNNNTSYGENSYGSNSGDSYGGYGVPANTVDPTALIKSTIKDIFNAVLKVATSLFAAITGILGASSADKGQYGPPQPSYYGPPQQANPYNSALRPPPK